MFHWICPECGRECAPSCRDCPDCYPTEEAGAVERLEAGSKGELPARAEAGGVAVLEAVEKPADERGSPEALAELSSLPATDGLAKPLLTLAEAAASEGVAPDGDAGEDAYQAAAIDGGDKDAAPGAGSVGKAVVEDSHAVVETEAVPKPVVEPRAGLYAAVDVEPVVEPVDAPDAEDSYSAVETQDVVEPADEPESEVVDDRAPVIAESAVELVEEPHGAVAFEPVAEAVDAPDAEDCCAVETQDIVGSAVEPEVDDPAAVDLETVAGSVDAADAEESYSAVETEDIAEPAVAAAAEVVDEPHAEVDLETVAGPVDAPDAEESYSAVETEDIAEPAVEAGVDEPHGAVDLEPVAGSVDAADAEESYSAVETEDIAEPAVAAAAEVVDEPQAAADLEPVAGSVDATDAEESYSAVETEDVVGSAVEAGVDEPHGAVDLEPVAGSVDAPDAEDSHAAVGAVEPAAEVVDDPHAAVDWEHVVAPVGAPDVEDSHAAIRTGAPAAEALDDPHGVIDLKTVAKPIDAPDFEPETDVVDDRFRAVADPVHQPDLDDWRAGDDTQEIVAPVGMSNVDVAGGAQESTVDPWDIGTPWEADEYPIAAATEQAASTTGFGTAGGNSAETPLAETTWPVPENADEVETVLGSEPPHRKTIPGWLISLIVAFLMLIAGLSILFYLLPASNGETRPASPSDQQGAVAPAASSSAAIPAVSTAAPAPPQTVLAKYIEITGLRISMDPNKRATVQYLVVNHSAAEVGDVAVNVVVRTVGDPQQPPIGSFTFRLPFMGPFESRELTAPINPPASLLEMPDWQSLTAVVHITGQ
jgi:hypothetical protein